MYFSYHRRWKIQSIYTETETETETETQQKLLTATLNAVITVMIF